MNAGMITTVLRKIFHEGRYEYLLLASMMVFTLFSGGYDGKFVTGDGHGYYAYLPALFIDHDLSYARNLRKQEEHYGKAHVADFRKKVNGRYVNKYFAGVSLLWLPFFLVAHLVALLTGVADGFAVPYQYAVALAALFYLGAGLCFLRKLLETYRLSGKMTGFLILLLVLGTNLSYFTLFDASYTHVYSFAVITAFSYYLRRFFLSGDSSHLVKGMVAFGLLVLIRPVNLLILLFLPFLAGSRERFLRAWRCVKGGTFLLMAIILVILALYQMAWWKVQTGSWIIWSYAGESFRFLHPHIVPFLFSYKKGVFVYAPVLLFALAGLWVWIRQRNVYLVISWLGSFVITVYVLSSWHPWWYGMSYGARPMIDYYVCFAIPMGVGLNASRGLWRKWMILAGSILIVINLVQEYQYYHFILHWENMDKESYWKVFLRTGKAWRGYLWK